MTPEALARAAAAVGEPQIAHGVVTVTVAREGWTHALAWARSSLGCTFFDFLCGVDELDGEPPAIAVVAHLHCPQERHHLLLRTFAPADDLRLPTVTHLFAGANWHERETHEMYGVAFDGHPNLIPLLLPDGFDGHPLRKDFLLTARVEKPWPGAVEPGQSARDTGRSPKRPHGVPAPARAR